MTNPFKRISRVNLHSEVMQQITAAIQSGQWKPGSKLPGEIGLAEMFQVSRTCIREVLKALAYSGVVESRSGVGTFVKEIPSEAPSPAVDLLSSTDYTQILEMRKLLEGQAAYWATERATPEEIAELESILKQEGLSLKDIHTRFHNGVTALSKNPILIHMLAEFQEQFKKQREFSKPSNPALQPKPAAPCISTSTTFGRSARIFSPERKAPTKCNVTPPLAPAACLLQRLVAEANV